METKTSNSNTATAQGYKIKVEIETKVPESFFQIFASIGFWNQQGADIYEQNRKGKMGTKASQELSRKIDYKEFILDNLLGDLRTILDGKGFKSGRGGSHLWVSNDKNERILFIY
jgi:hypothetical protein